MYVKCPEAQRGYGHSFDAYRLALESISDTSKKLFGDGSPAATIWTDTLRTTLLERGWDGFDERWQDTRDTFPANAPQRTRLKELRNNLGHHVSHLNYAERLCEGRSIKSKVPARTSSDADSNKLPPAGESAATHALSRVCPPHDQPLLHQVQPPVERLLEPTRRMKPKSVPTPTNERHAAIA